MKTFLFSLGAILVITTAKAQNFTENFNLATISSLTNQCWVLNGVSTTTQNGEAINGTSLYTAPPTNPGSKIDLYSPILNFLSTSTTINFDYRLTQAISGNTTRSIQISLVNLSGFIIKSDTITMGAGTNTDVRQYQNTFSSITTGAYRLVLRVWGSQGNGNVRLVLDNYQVSNSILNVGGAGGCVFVPIVESLLPVQLKFFTAQLNNNKVDLKWTTSSEINVSHFVIERSTDGYNYMEAGIVFANGNASDITNYTFSDNAANMQSGIYYYRLRSLDIDGKGQYSETRIIRISKQSENNITILSYPNPVTNELRITIPANWQNKKVIYELFNSNGQVSKKTENASSSQTESLNVNSIAPGFYLVRVTCNGETAQQKIVKQ